MLKKAIFKIKGMSRDLAATAFNSQYAYENKNVRIMTTTEENTLLSLVNEKGTLKADLDIIGFPIGQSVLNNEAVLFTTSKEFSDINIEANEEVINTINAESSNIKNIDNYDRIYKLWIENNAVKSKLLYSGNLDFSYKNPIETLSIYENENIKKVYWVDGKNQPRVINISKVYSNNLNKFDFVRDINLNYNISIKANLKQSGQFNSGVVQYACSYYDKNGQESNIFYESPLYYAAMNNRGGSPEETSSNTFDIEMSNLDTNFEYVRLYSIFRTSLDSTPTVKIVGDFKTNSSVKYTDTNTSGITIDPTMLLYIGGESIVAGTINQKDNTLFLGDISLKRSYIPTDVKNTIKGNSITFYSYESPIKYSPFGNYQYKSQLEYSSSEITSFKYNETYRFGVQFQHKTGKWSDVCFIKDAVVNVSPEAKVNNELTYIELVKAKTTLPESIISTLQSLGYVKARGVVVYPSNSDRTVIAQGVVNPVIYRKIDRENNNIHAISSWFFRPMSKSITEEDKSVNEALYGTYAEFRDGVEVNSPITPSRKWEIGVDLGAGSYNYYVDSGFLTFHSPDIEFNNINISDNSLQFRIVGFIKMSGLLACKEVTSTTPPLESTDIGFINDTPSHSLMNIYGYIGGNGLMLSSGINWVGTGKDGKIRGWLVSPWQRSGSLVDDIPSSDNNSTAASELKNNRTSNLRYSYETVFNTSFWSPNYGISNIEVFDSNELTVLKINDDKTYNYYGNYDTIVNPMSGDVHTDSYIGVTSYGNTEPINYYFRDLVEDGTIKTSNPVHIKFKAGKHAVFKFKNSSSGDRVILPNPYGSSFIHYNQTDKNPPIFSNYATGPNTTVDADILWLGEIYRPSVANRFGGDNDNALLNNKWIVAGDSVDLGSTIYFTQGDTYVQRYDCLKTYPYSFEDTNNVTEILSFFCETRINIDGRYDRNRGNKNNTTISLTNFNLLNNVYTQNRNFFIQNYVTEDISSLDEFKNTVIWSKIKTLGESVDNWTNITLASTLDLDGDKGPVRALKRINNNLIAFQDKGISQILYNESVQLASTEGVPIEIANSGKVSGKRYISDRIGCMNKWSICETPSGLYFIDDITKGIYLFNGQLDNISDKLGFHSWINSRSKDLYVWNPKDFNGFVTYYDKVNGDIFFITKEECLAYSEPLKEFTSFYSYEYTPYFINIQDRGLFFKNTDDNNTSVWLHNEGKYNYYFDTYQPFYTTIIANPEAINDKTFSMVEFRADTWNDKTLLATSFDNLEAWNEYQSTASKLVTKLGVPSNLKRKFRIWRAQIPRDKSNNRDRMRNPWLYIKMEMKNPNENKTLLQDLTVVYF